MKEHDELLEDALEMISGVNFPENLTLDEYQRMAVATCVYPKSTRLKDLTLGLCSEAGEVAGKMKKISRDKGGVMSEEDRVAILKELGDTLWYLVNLINFLYASAGDVGADNIKHLRDRQKRGVLRGSGDDR